MLRGLHCLMTSLINGTRVTFTPATSDLIIMIMILMHSVEHST